MPYPAGGGGGGFGTAGGGITAVKSGGNSGGSSFSRTVPLTKGVSNMIYSLSSTVADDAMSSKIPKSIIVSNPGNIATTIIAEYESYSDETTAGNAAYLHVKLKPGGSWDIPINAVVSTESATTMFDGTAVDNDAPNSNEYVAVSAYIDGAGLASGTTATTFDVDNNGSPSAAAAVGFFHIGDRLRIENEVLEITAIAANTGTEAQLTVIRGVDGSTAATHADNTQLRLPFYNAYHDYDKFSVAQTDNDGRFKCFNFFGVGRANSGVQGIVPGSVSIKFYNAGYQEWGMSGVTSATHSGLAASTEYKFNITVDGGSTFSNLTFTTDSSNLNFGGTNGVISKIQDALDTQYYTSGNLFEKKVHVAIVGGDVRFTSGTHLSTSAILMAAPTSGTTPFGVGRIPAIGNIDAAVAARLPDDVTYDKVTYEANPAPVFCHDDGHGNLHGMATGTINYETGAIDFTNAPPNAEFVYSVAHTSAFSGKVESGTSALVKVMATTVSAKANGTVSITVK
tara:strand:+ start:842 stop:2371 length:1530 start_codon:yes stop_codon:yes gene_type:complete